MTSGSSATLRGGVWLLIAFCSFFSVDTVLFRAGWYQAYLEPDSTTGSLEYRLYWLAHSKRPAVPEVLAIGDSRMAEGFSTRVANAETARQMHFWNLGLGGTTPRVWYYLLRDADPTRRRFASVVVGLDDYSDADWFASFEDRATDQNYLAMRLGLADCPGFAWSMHKVTAGLSAFFGCAFREEILRRDIDAFLANPPDRLTRAADTRARGLIYLSEYEGKTGNLQGMTIDWNARAIHFPDTASEATRENVRKFVTKSPVPQTGALARYRKQWLGAILNLYRNSPTRVIFLQMPRAPVVDPAQGSHALTIDHAIVLPAATFEDLERPELFADGLHLNSAGRAIFSRRMAKVVAAAH